MDSMLSAIKAKRQGLGGAMGQKTMMDQAPEQEGSGLQGLVEQLSPEQKQELMMLLQSEQSMKSEDIEQGAPSKNEKKIIEAKAMEEEGEMGSDESDAIAMSMIDRNSLQKAEAGVKPRGLGDRAKMAMAEKLKEKGKLK